MKKLVVVNVTSDPAVGGGFSPSNLLISKGTTVRFVWTSAGHNVAPFHRDIEMNGFTFDLPFNQTGRFPFLCQVHPGQNGIIIVQ